jgi:glycerol-3-phosphate acyltransferase PlsY
MDELLLGLLAALIGYLLGSIPSAYIVTRLRKGVDIRELDSTHNVGAASVMRQVGMREGLIAGAVDAAKGAAAVLIALALQLSEPWVLAAGFAAVIGHGFPVYIKFRGGQGMATLVGIYFVLSPWAALTFLALMGIVLLFLRNIFLSLVVTGPLIPLFVWLYGGSMLLIGFSLLIVIYMVLRNYRGFVQFKEVRLSNPLRRKKDM